MSRRLPARPSFILSVAKEDTVEKIYILRARTNVCARVIVALGRLKSGGRKPLNENPSGATRGFERTTVKPHSIARNDCFDLKPIFQCRSLPRAAVSTEAGARGWWIRQELQEEKKQSCRQPPLTNHAVNDQACWRLPSHHHTGGRKFKKDDR